MSILFLIPARGGSKGLPGKNLRAVGAIPLVARAIRVALRAASALDGDSRVICSTDDEAIAKVAREWGAAVPFLRPAELAADASPTLDVVLHALEALAPMSFETVVLLQPTSPLVDAGDVVGAVGVHRGSGAPVVSVCRVEHPVEWSLRLDPDGRLRWISGEPVARRRQDAAPTLRLNGAVYVATPAQLRAGGFVGPDTRGYEMPAERSVDVDGELDLLVATSVLARAAHAANGAGAPRTVRFAGKAIGEGEPCLVIAEAGVNHNGDVSVAKRLVDAAAASGADAVKFQTFRADRLAVPSAPKAEYQRQGTPADESQLAMLRRLELSEQAHRELVHHCHEAGIVFLSSPFDEASADLLSQLGVAAFKIPSGELTNLPLLAHVAAKGVPMILSTGMSTLREVDLAVTCAREAGARDIVLLHCLSSYPAPIEEVNLRAMSTMSQAFGVPVGYSDHTLDDAAALAAVALGARVIEKHLTLDRCLPGPDQKASMEPGELGSMIARIRAVEAALGHGRKEPAPSERETAAVARKSIVAALAIAAGAVIVREMLAVRRPGTGIAAAELDSVLGRRAKAAIAEGELLRWEMLG